MSKMEAHTFTSKIKNKSKLDSHQLSGSLDLVLALLHSTSAFGAWALWITLTGLSSKSQEGGRPQSGMLMELTCKYPYSPTQSYKFLLASPFLEHTPLITQVF